MAYTLLLTPLINAVLTQSEPIGHTLMEFIDYDRAAEKVGGAFRLSVLLQKRVRELVRGSQPLVEAISADSTIDIALREILCDKVSVAAADRVGVLSIEQAVNAVAAGASEDADEDKDDADEKDTKKKTKKRAKK